MARSALRVQVVSPQARVLEGEASALMAPVWDGRVGILPGHAPMIALLGAGPLTLDLPGGGSSTVYVAGGVMKVEDNEVTVLTEFASEVEPLGGPPPGLAPPDEDEIREALEEEQESF